MVQDPQVLVIDDETGSRESMALAIQRAGFVVRTFDDARRALELLEETDTPQLAVCDLRMPGLDALGPRVAALRLRREASRRATLGVPPDDRRDRDDGRRAQRH